MPTRGSHRGAWCALALCRGTTRCSTGSPSPCAGATTGRPSNPPTLLKFLYTLITLAAWCTGPVQGYDALFYGDSITMRWRDDWPANQWSGPLPRDTPGGTPEGVFNATFRVNYTSNVMGVGSAPLLRPCSL